MIDACQELADVSIHALLAECDKIIAAEFAFKRAFQSTHSLRSATFEDINIPIEQACFNPRTPCGVRLLIRRYPAPEKLFQSTHSLRSATRKR